MDNNKDKQQNSGDETPIYLTANSTLQTSSEHRHDQGVDPRKDNSIGVASDEIGETDISRIQENELDGERGNGKENDL